MKLTPRYDGPPVLRFEGPIGDPSVALLRQRRRLGDVLSSLDESQWSAPTRCDGWTVREVIAHLTSTNGFWVVSINAGLAGEPTRYLTGFDPVSTPASLVDAMDSMSSGDVLARYHEGIEQLAAVVTGLDEDQWRMLAESPPGHVELHALTRHALWDAWIHERDVLLPLGMTQEIEADEVLACLEYAAGVSPGFDAAHGCGRPAVIEFAGTDPDTRVAVETDGTTVTVRPGEAPDGAVRFTGPTVELIDALSRRGPFPCEVADADRWLVSGLATVFDQAS